MKTDIKELHKEGSLAGEGSDKTGANKIYRALVDIIDKGDDIILVADMPGVDEKSVDITLEKDTLTLYGKVETETPENRRSYASEYGVGDYRRVFTLSDEIDREKIKATVKNGVLRLVLPKTESVRARKILVKAGDE
jgi:HSP20 family molecular chaperone IbpA